MLRLILGRAGSGKTARVLRRLCRGGPDRRQILVVPEQQSHEAERALCRFGGDGVSLYAEVLSFSRLSNRVFLAAGGMGEPELDAGGRILLMHRAVRSVASQLTVYARPSRQPRLSGGAAVHRGRAEELLRPAGAPAPGGGGGRRGRGGQAAGPGAHLHRLRGPGRPHRPGPPGPAHPDGGEAEGLPLGGREPTCGWTASPTSPPSSGRCCGSC